MPDNMNTNGIEYQLKLYVTPADLKLSEQKPSDIIRFMQAGLNALGYQGPVDGVYSQEFQQNLNGFVVQKQQEKVGVLKGWAGDNHTVVAPVQGVAALSGTHIAAISDSLYEGGLMVPELQVQLLAGLKQINSPYLNSYTQRFEQDLRQQGVPLSEKAPTTPTADSDVLDPVRIHNSMFKPGKPS